MPVWLIPMLYTVAGARDPSGTIRVGFPMPTWQDYLGLSLDEIRQLGAASVQVVRPLRAALVGLADSTDATNRREAVLQYLDHLNRSVARSAFDDQDQAHGLAGGPSRTWIAAQKARMQRAAAGRGGRWTDGIPS